MVCGCDRVGGWFVGVTEWVGDLWVWPSGLWVWQSGWVVCECGGVGECFVGVEGGNLWVCGSAWMEGEFVRKRGK